MAHGTPPSLLVCELSAAGYRLIHMSPLTGGLGYFAVFQPPAKPTSARHRVDCKG